MIKMSAQKREYNKEISSEMITESEKKRLKSLKRQKQTFKAKELAVKNALKNLDNKPSQNKIIFDEDIDIIKQPEVKKKIQNKRNLFDNDDDDDNDGAKDNGESLWDIDNLESKRSIAGKPYGHSLTLGNDKRFKLDERFLDDDHKPDENVTVEHSDESDLLKEKQLQLDILGNILGVPITSKKASSNKEANKELRKEMIRYDPTESNHKEYEITTEKSEENVKTVRTRKKTKEATEDVENSQVEVSKDIYFSVSDSLSKSLKEGGNFSLLQTYGKEHNEKVLENEEYNATVIQPVKPKFQFNFDAKNPFKYDSSDDETDMKEELKTDNKECTQNEQDINDRIVDTNNFFFDVKDARFNDAVKFFSKEFIPDDDFKNLRRELKQLVRSKVRQNVKKNQPWGHKRKIKRFH
ncbi:uncharacterized protein LOC143184325 isoform X2 [Calliopsis andreniformis]|uniref:uncharacterized protein LOC143184325 isoform X2 n=1 Tax=Calliopsis andreniformis TaxID=337506 RepID=UPI003FCE5A79